LQTEKLLALPDSFTNPACINQEMTMKAKIETASKPKSGGPAQRAPESNDSNAAPANDAISREQFIAVAAYFRAEQRGFTPGNEMSDWLDAEADVENMLGSSSTTPSMS
jgi:hypothetical protein